MAIKRHIVLLMVIGLFTSCATQRAKYVTYVPDSAVVFEAIKAEIQYLDIPKDNNIEVLSLTNCGLDRIPSSIKHCKHLQRLNLEGNQILTKAVILIFLMIIYTLLHQMKLNLQMVIFYLKKIIIHCFLEM